ncbi:hypothetical protein C8A03DRAFT_36553 [Achaetomium macrosporum]|uniref:C2H2-type domain-containing protein n=1 Tax=Achaetomium macrosporum TaxID=79813 RepID=A0AAN7HBW6_9PEZI|nr:hypothetical protein C8A03DRAFT_36553 [Achaetomium macrosporum]
MDLPLDISGTWECPDWFSWDGNNLNHIIDSVLENFENAGLNDTWLADRLPNTATTTGAQFKDLNLTGLLPDVLVLEEYSIHTDPPELQSPRLTGAFSTNGSSGSGYSPSSIETGFPSPWTPWETPCVTPEMLKSQSPPTPLSNLSTAQGDSMDTPPCVEDCMTSNVHAGYGPICKMPIKFPGTSVVQQPPPQAAVTDTTLTMEDKPPGVSSRAWRYQIRPEKCPICGKGHTFRSELEKHVAAKHPDVAPDLGVSTKRHVCDLCQESLARNDHLVRHKKNKHGIEPQNRRKKPGGVTKK